MRLGVWLHDIGHYPLPTEIDHAVRGEERAREFLTNEGFDRIKIERVCHCVRAHRCKDVLPETIEARIIAAADSAGHITDTAMYPSIAQKDKQNGVPFRVYAKIERDWRDLAFFPEVQTELEELHQAWKVVLKAYEKIAF